MKPLRASAIVPLILVAGCWPYLGGPYDDYVDGDGTSDPDTSDRDTSDRDTSDRDTSDRDTSDPDTSDPDTTVPGDGPTLFGTFRTVQLMGGYWGEANDASFYTIAVASAEPGFGWTHAENYPDEGECSGGRGFSDDLDAFAIDIGLPNTFTAGASGRPVSMSVWEGNANARAGSEAATQPLRANVEGRLSITVDDGTVDGTFSRTPSDFVWSQPRVDGDNIQTLAAEPFNVSWSGTGGDTMIAILAFQDGDFQTLSAAACNVTDGAFSLDPAAGPEGSEFMEIRLLRIREFSATVPGSAGVESVVAGVLEKRGYVAFPAQ